MVRSWHSSRTRRTRDGRRRYRVWWRLGGTRYGEPQSETFFDKGSALTFKLAAEAASHDWPDGYIRGVGWVTDQPHGELEPAAEPMLFGDYAGWSSSPASTTCGKPTWRG